MLKFLFLVVGLPVVEKDTIFGAALQVEENWMVLFVVPVRFFFAPPSNKEDDVGDAGGVDGNAAADIGMEVCFNGTYSS